VTRRRVVVALGAALAGAAAIGACAGSGRGAGDRPPGRSGQAETVRNPTTGPPLTDGVRPTTGLRQTDGVRPTTGPALTAGPRPAAGPRPTTASGVVEVPWATDDVTAGAVEVPWATDDVTSGTETGDAGSTAGWRGPHRSEDGALELRIADVPEVPPAGPMQSWVLRVTDGAGAPVEGAQVTVDGLMPKHGHGLSTVPRVGAGLGEGRYRVDGLRFQMPGRWVLFFDVAPPGAPPTRFAVALEVE